MLKLLAPRAVTAAADLRKAELAEVESELEAAHAKLDKNRRDTAAQKAEFDEVWGQARPDRNGPSAKIETLRLRGFELDLARQSLAEEVAKLDSRAEQLRSQVYAAPRLEAARKAVAAARNKAEAATGDEAKARAGLETLQQRLAAARVHAEAAMDAAAEALTKGGDMPADAANAQTTVAALARAVSQAEARLAEASHALTAAREGISVARQKLRETKAASALVEAEQTLLPLIPMLARAAVAAGHPNAWKIHFVEEDIAAARADLDAD